MKSGTYTKDEEVTKNTCPACNGSGAHEYREETATSYSVSSTTCWLCSGDRVVGPDKMAVYAKACERLRA